MSLVGISRLGEIISPVADHPGLAFDADMRPKRIARTDEGGWAP